jgi:hypothetical protein
MTELELDLFAAKSVGYVVLGDKHTSDGLNVIANGRTLLWRPRYDDGDALRLAAKAGITLYMNCGFNGGRLIAESSAKVVRDEVVCMNGDIEIFMFALRKAIVRVAAEIGKEKAG